MRFASDLEDLAAAARSSPPFTPAAPTSRPAADLLLLIEWTEVVKGGCASTAGTVITTLPAIVWNPHDAISGTIPGVDFDAQLTGGAWTVTIHAC